MYEHMDPLMQFGPGKIPNQPCVWHGWRCRRCDNASYVLLTFFCVFCFAHFFPQISTHPLHLCSAPSPPSVKREGFAPGGEREKQAAEEHAPWREVKTPLKNKEPKQLTGNRLPADAKTTCKEDLGGQESMGHTHTPQLPPPPQKILPQ